MVNIMATINPLFATIGIILYLTLIPFLGKKLYPIRGKKLISIYIIGISVVFGFSMVFMSSINPSNAGTIFQEFQGQLSNPVFYLLFLCYMCAGVGIFGSLAEKSAEIIEDVDLFKDLKKTLSVKRFIMNMIYGNCFLYSVYSANEVFIILLDIQYKDSFLWFVEIWKGLGYTNIFVVLIGINFFFLKAFRLGFFSFEYWKVDLSLKREKYAILRKLLVIFLYIWANYIALMMFVIEKYGLNNTFHVAFTLNNLVFHVFTVSATLIFYLNMRKIVDALKSGGKDYKKKINKQIIIEPEADSDYSNELKFD